MFCNYYENSKLLQHSYSYTCNNTDWYPVEDLSRSIVYIVWISFEITFRKLTYFFFSKLNSSIIVFSDHDAV